MTKYQTLEKLDILRQTIKDLPDSVDVISADVVGYRDSNVHLYDGVEAVNTFAEAKGIGPHVSLEYDTRKFFCTNDGVEVFTLLH